VKYLKSFAIFCYDFVVGDDWRMALGVIIGLALTYVLAHNGINAFLLLPVFVVGVLALSLRRARRKAAGK
jgi:hypothetical protein